MSILYKNRLDQLAKQLQNTLHYLFRTLPHYQQQPFNNFLQRFYQSFYSQLLHQKQSQIQKLLNQLQSIANYLQKLQKQRGEQKLEQLRANYQKKISLKQMEINDLKRIYQYQINRLKQKFSHSNSDISIDNKMYIQQKLKQLQIYSNKLQLQKETMQKEIKIIKDQQKRAFEQINMAQKQNFIINQRLKLLEKQKLQFTQQIFKLSTINKQILQNIQSLESQQKFKQQMQHKIQQLQTYIVSLQEGSKDFIQKADKLQLQIYKFQNQIANIINVQYVQIKQIQQMKLQNERLYQQLNRQTNNYQKIMNEKQNYYNFHLKQKNQKMRLVVDSLNEHLSTIQENIANDEIQRNKNINEKNLCEVISKIKNLKTQLQIFLKILETEFNYFKNQIEEVLFSTINRYFFHILIKIKNCNQKEIQEIQKKFVKNFKTKNKGIVQYIKQQLYDADNQIKELKLTNNTLQNQIIKFQNLYQIQVKQNERIKFQNNQLVNLINNLQNKLDQKFPEIAIKHYECEETIARQRLMIEERIESQFKKEIYKIMFQMKGKQLQNQKLILRLEKCKQQKLKLEQKLNQLISQGNFNKKGYKYTKIRSNKLC